MPGWRWAMACETGARHIASGGPCEDACAAREIASANGPVLVVAVADGAGSSALAQIGAQEAVGHFCDGAARALGGLSGPPDVVDLRAIMQATRDHLERLSRFSCRPLDNYSTTLLAALIGEAWSAFVQIGDGAIVRDTDTQGEWGWMFLPHKGLYANETVFLTHPDAADIAHADVLAHAPTEIALFTDGLENLLIREGAERRVVDTFFNEMMPPVRALERPGEDRDLSKALGRYLGSDAINSRTDDDKTLVLATRLDAPGVVIDQMASADADPD